MNTRQQKFCREYILDGNATRAAIAAGYSAKTADKIASRMLRFVEVKETVTRMKEEANAAADAAAFASFRDKRAILKRIITNPKAGTRDRLKAIEVDNVMAGDNAAQRIDVTSGAEPIRPVINFVCKIESAE